MDQTYKFDGGKLQYRLIPPFALEEVARALTYGAQKYSAYSWVNVESHRYLDAAYRHLETFRKGQRYDEESQLPHLAMAVTNLMFLLEREAYDDTTHGKPLETYYEEVASQVDRDR
jgi:hypothetical protein